MIVPVRVFSDDESTTSSSAYRSGYESTASAPVYTSCPPPVDNRRDHIPHVGHMAWTNYNREYVTNMDTNNENLIPTALNVLTPPYTSPQLPQYSDLPEVNYVSDRPPNYGVSNVIREGHWNLNGNSDIHLLPPSSLSKIESSQYWSSPPTYGESFSQSDETNSLLKLSQDEDRPLIKSMRRCTTCKRRFTSRTKTNYWTIFFLILVILCLLLSFFPWGFVALLVLAYIPSQINKPTCKKCQKRCCY